MLAIVSKVTKVEVGEIFWKMPLLAVYAYEHCYYQLEGVHCKYPAWSPYIDASSNLTNLLFSTEEEEEDGNSITEDTDRGNTDVAQ